jgi:hypothetical protein
MSKSVVCTLLPPYKGFCFFVFFFFSNRNAMNHIFIPQWQDVGLNQPLFYSILFFLQKLIRTATSKLQNNFKVKM